MQHELSGAHSHQVGSVSFSEPSEQPSHADTDKTTPQRKHMSTGKVGMRVRSLHEETLQIIKWEEVHLKSLKAIHVTKQENIVADCLSRETMSNNEWMLNLDMFTILCNKFGIPGVDLFATVNNRQVPNFFTRGRSETAMGTDTLTSNWLSGLLYAFPPIHLLPRVIQKIIQQKAEF